MRLLSRNFGSVAALFGVASILTVWAAPVNAVPFLQALIQNTGFGTVACSFSGGSSPPSGCNAGDDVGGSIVSDGATQGGSTGPQAIGAASARVGSLSNFAEGISRVSTSGNPVVRSTAKFFFDDLVFTGPAGATEVTASVNFFVDGAIGGSRVIGGPNRTGEYSLTLFADNSLIGSGSVKGDIAGSAIQNTGLFGGTGTSSSVNGLFVSNSFTFSLGTAHSLQFNALATASAVSASTSLGPFGATASTLTVDFANTTSLGSTVFNLPDGFTANSQQSGIVNNSFGVTATVPEPGTLELLGLGLAGFSLAHFCRRRIARGEQDYTQSADSPQRSS